METVARATVGTGKLLREAYTLQLSLGAVYVLAYAEVGRVATDRILPIWEKSMRRVERRERMAGY